MPVRPFAVLAFAALLLSPVTLGAQASRWPLVAFDSAETCDLTVSASRIAMRFEAQGLIPGENIALSISNGDMKPIAQNLRADANGRLVRFYSPVRLNRENAVVTIRLDGARCSLTVSAPWSRSAPTIS